MEAEKFEDTLWGIYEELIRRCGGYPAKARGSLSFVELVTPNDEAFFRTIFFPVLNGLPFKEEDRDYIVTMMKKYGGK